MSTADRCRTARAWSPALGFVFSAMLLAQESGQPQPAEDPERDVVAACEHAKFGVRQAAAKRVAAAGDRSVSAIRNRIRNKGMHSVPQTLVEAIASAESNGPEVVGLLNDWSDQREFYWRSQALKGLANRRSPASKERFAKAVGDPAWNFRVQGARGLAHLGDRATALAMLEDPDPRARVAIAICLAEELKDLAGLPILINATTWNDVFLDDPWGRQQGQLAERSLQRLGKLPTTRPQATSQPSADTTWSGIEIRSCREGDWFVRWNAAGKLLFGLRGETEQQLPAQALERVLQALPKTVTKPAVHGDVVCDYAQLVLREPALRWKAAPGSLPVEFAAMLKQLAQTLEEHGAKDRATELRRQFDQFLSPSTR